MKHLCAILFILFTLSPALAENVTIGPPVSSVEDFLKLRNEIATTPEGGAACFVATLLAFGESKDVGMQCLTIAIDKRNVIKGGVYKGYAPGSSVMYHINRISGYKMWPYLGRAYIKGAKASENYQITGPWQIETYRQKNSGDESSGRVKVFVKTDGFRARPVTLKRNDKGLWKAYEFSSLLLNVNPPANLTPTDDL